MLLLPKHRQVTPGPPWQCGSNSCGGSRYDGNVTDGRLVHTTSGEWRLARWAPEQDMLQLYHRSPGA